MKNKILTKDLLERRIAEFRDLGKEALSRDKELIEATLKGGLTRESAVIDTVALKKQLDSIETETDRLINRKVIAGDMAASLPYDMPNFLMSFYVAPMFITRDKNVHVKFASIMRDVGTIWKESISNQGIEGIIIENDISGRDFGKKCIKNPNIRNFIIAGSGKIVDYYSNPEVYSNFDNTIIFGPTRTKALFTESANLDTFVPMTVQNSMFSSGQICALTKEIIPVSSNYEQVKDLLIENMDKVEWGDSDKKVGPIMDRPAFKKDIELLNMFKKSKRYNIIYGGKYDDKKNLIQPTIIECTNGVSPKIDYFGPMLLLNKSAKDTSGLIDQVHKDYLHGGYVWIYTQNPVEGFSLEGKMLKEASTVRLNTDIMSSSIDWPYGGLKESFKLIKKENGGYTTHRGRIYLSKEVSKENSS